jgi:ribosome biogenesis ATPase
VAAADVDAALKSVQPSAIREGFTTVPDVSWDDIGALHDVREELHMCVVKPISAPEQFARLGLSAPAGVLLYGPPGCGKTLLAKAVAHASHANFISIKGPELLDKYVGESERAVRQVFTRARASAPCVVFFDELDALAPRRGAGSEGGSGVSERVVNQLLTELDGMGGRRSVFVIGATNRPDMIDSAMLRPGRLDKLLYVPLPSPQQRADILAKAARHTPLGADVDLVQVSRSPQCEGFSGADLAALVREASLQCLRETFKQPPPVEGAELSRVSAANFAAALSKTRPSVSASERRMFDKLARSLSSSMPAALPAAVTEANAPAQPTASE